MVNVVLTMETKKDEHELMPMEESIRLPEDTNDLANFLAEYYGLPISECIKEIELEYRRQMVKQAQQRIIQSVDNMDKLYKEDKELTELTKSLEYEDFYGY